MTENVRFHRLVSGLCLKSKKEEGDGTLILVDRQELGHNLKKAIEQTGLRVEFIMGKTPQKKRKEVIAAFEKRELDVLIGGKIINRGLDLKGGCETLIVACGGKLQSDFRQKLGRAVRINKQGRSKVYDFFFRCNKYLYDHSKHRLKSVLAEGYNTRIVFPGGIIDGAELVKSRFQIKKKLLVKA
jgi:superfamily II DNA or RNA helicase